MGHEVGHYVTGISIYQMIDSLTYNLNTVKCMILRCKFSEFKGIYGTTKTFPRFTLPSPVKVCSCHIFINPHPHPHPMSGTTLLISFST